MVKHIVMWKLKDENKAENAQKLKSMLEGLMGIVPELKSAEVGIGALVEKDGFDAVLVSTFESFDDLEKYKVHPDHQKISEFVKSIRLDRKVCDFEF